MKNRTLILLIAFGLVALGVVLGQVMLFVTQKPSHSISPEALKLALQEKPLKHLGIIMDGNRRWAQSQGLKPWIGHRKGVDSIKETLQFCKEYAVPELTLYVFSLENFNRPPEELSFLFDILAQEIASHEMENLFKEGVRVRFIGDRALFPQKLVPLITDIEQKTAQHTNLTLNLLFCYGGQQEMAAAARAITARTSAEEFANWEQFKKYLWSAELPNIDLVIRTAGDQRLSNFLPMQSAYSELYFTPCLWPEMRKEDLMQAAEFFVNCKRNFGK